MWTLAFYLAVLNFFFKEGKVKKIIGRISIVFTSIVLLWVLLDSLGGIGGGIDNIIDEIIYFLSIANPCKWIFYWLWPSAKLWNSSPLLAEIFQYLIHILQKGLQIFLAAIAMRTTIMLVDNDGKKKISVDFKRNPKKENPKSEEEAKLENEVISSIPPEYKPISMWGYFGYEILFAIPLIGQIILLVKAVSSKNKNVKNFARSYFCLLIIALISTVIGFAISANFR